MTPNDRKYSKDHEWVLVEGNKAKVGITYHAQSELGDIVFIDLPAIGDVFAQGDCLSVIESVKAASEIFTPVAGKIIAVNEELDEAAEKINSDPYGAFIAEFEVTGIADDLMTAEEYEAYIK